MAKMSKSKDREHRKRETETERSKQHYVIVRLNNIELYYTRIKRRRGAQTITFFQWFSHYSTAFSSFP